jgi:hypothetical protein
MEKFWMIWRVDGQGPTKKNGSLKEAKAEAERLAISLPGRKFAVIEPEKSKTTLSRISPRV